MDEIHESELWESPIDGFSEQEIGARLARTEQESRRTIFALLDIIYEQSEAISGLLIEIGPAKHPEFYQAAMERHQRTRKKFLRMAVGFGWSPEDEPDGVALARFCGDPE